MNLKEIIIQEARKDLTPLWRPNTVSPNDWQRNHLYESGIEYWYKKCELFEVYVTHYGNNTFDITLLTEGEVRFKFGKLTLNNSEEARELAYEAAKEFIRIAAETWLPDEVKNLSR